MLVKFLIYSGFIFGMIDAFGPMMGVFSVF